jgi:hypothetical protein
MPDLREKCLRTGFLKLSLPGNTHRGLSHRRSLFSNGFCLEKVPLCRGQKRSIFLRGPVIIKSTNERHVRNNPASSTVSYWSECYMPRNETSVTPASNSGCYTMLQCPSRHIPTGPSSFNNQYHSCELYSRFLLFCQL